MADDIGQDQTTDVNQPKRVPLTVYNKSPRMGYLQNYPHHPYPSAETYGKAGYGPEHPVEDPSFHEGCDALGCRIGRYFNNLGTVIGNVKEHVGEQSGDPIGDHDYGLMDIPKAMFGIYPKMVRQYPQFLGDYPYTFTPDSVNKFHESGHWQDLEKSPYTVESNRKWAQTGNQGDLVPLPAEGSSSAPQTFPLRFNPNARKTGSDATQPSAISSMQPLAGQSQGQSPTQGTQQGGGSFWDRVFNKALPAAQKRFPSNIGGAFGQQQAGQPQGKTVESQKMPILGGMLHGGTPQIPPPEPGKNILGIGSGKTYHLLPEEKDMIGNIQPSEYDKSMMQSGFDTIGQLGE